MFPTLIEFPDWIPLLGGRALHTYGALVAMGFLAGLFWIRYESKRVGLPQDKMVDLFSWIVLSAIVGSRLMYVFVSVPEWWSDPLVFLRFWEGGLVFYGGLIAAVLTSVWYANRHKLSFFSVADVFTPGIALGHFFGRLGCFAAGCCYGREINSNSFWAVWFPKTRYSIAPHDHPVYPSQLFEAGAVLLLFLFLMLFRKRKKIEGEIFLLYIIIYPVLRSFLETFRGDEVRGFLVGDILSTAQFISILWVVVAGVLMVYLRKRRA